MQKHGRPLEYEVNVLNKCKKSRKMHYYSAILESINTSNQFALLLLQGFQQLSNEKVFDFLT